MKPSQRVFSIWYHIQSSFFKDETKLKILSEIIPLLSTKVFSSHQQQFNPKLYLTVLPYRALDSILENEMEIKTWFEMKQPLISIFLTLLEHGVPPSLLSFVADPSCSGYAAL